MSIYHVSRYDPSLARFEDPPVDEKPKDADDLTHCPSCVRYQKLEDVSVYSSHSDWKPGKIGRHFPVREKSGNFEQTGKVRENHTKYWKTQGN